MRANPQSCLRVHRQRTISFTGCVLNSADSVCDSGDDCDHNRQPSDHYRRVLDDPAGYTAGWLPRMWIVQTSQEGYGQIYVGVVNWLLMIVTVCLTLFFGKSDNLAAAYGIAVSATMILTSGLLFIAMRDIWGWSLLTSAAVAGVFFCIDAGFFSANLVKVAQGGYVPLLLAALVYGIMLIWHRGSVKVGQRRGERIIPVDEFMRSIKSQNIPRVPGIGVFLTRTARDAPPVMLWHVKHNRALQEKCSS